MSGHEPLPQDLEHVAEMLRDGRDEATPFELDRIKLRVMAQDARFSARTTGGLVKSRLAIMLALVLGLALSGTGATLAVTGGSGSGTDAASKEYKGCVDKHGHAKKCKKPHKTCADKKPADQAKCQQKDQQNFDKKHSDWQKKRDNCNAKSTQAERDKCNAQVQQQQDQTKAKCDDQALRYENPDTARQQCYRQKGLDPSGGGPQLVMDPSDFAADEAADDADDANTLGAVVLPYLGARVPSGTAGKPSTPTQPAPARSTNPVPVAPIQNGSVKSAVTSSQPSATGKAGTYSTATGTAATLRVQPARQVAAGDGGGGGMSFSAGLPIMVLGFGLLAAGAVGLRRRRNG